MGNERLTAVCFWITIVTPAFAVGQTLDTTQLTRDINGRWRPAESRTVEVRQVGPSERWEEETVRRPGLSGTLVLSERNVTHRFEANGVQQQVIETFCPDSPGSVGFDQHPTLCARVRVSTTPAPDGGRQTIEEVERRNEVALSDPMRVVRRVVETVRNVGPDRWMVERQVFERDVNGRLAPISIEREERVSR